MTDDAHGRGAGAPRAFTDENVPAPTHAERARTLIARHQTGTLGTLAVEPAGYPYGSFVPYAVVEGEPVFLISRLAEHTRNLAADARASLLVHETGKADPLANARVTLLGRAQRLEKGPSSAREQFLATHPHARHYADYSDFEFWRLSVESLRYIGGYGRMSWIQPDDFRAAEPDPLAESATHILSHMNNDHPDALRLYSRAFTRAVDAESAVMTAIDRYGFELTITTPSGSGPARIAFELPLNSAEDAHDTLIALVHVAELLQ
ncbi:MAG TPA: DUF2470 domain-containing protein [Polyangiaceae bacterium]|nr:DUF2470 domain-containing protein [Polyangiaceae bacterium]